jgi:hypothetical protein
MIFPFKIDVAMFDALIYVSNRKHGHNENALFAPRMKLEKAFTEKDPRFSARRSTSQYNLL